MTPMKLTIEQKIRLADAYVERDPEYAAEVLDEMRHESDGLEEFVAMIAERVYQINTLRSNRAPSTIDRSL